MGQNLYFSSKSPPQLVHTINPSLASSTIGVTCLVDISQTTRITNLPYFDCWSNWRNASFFWNNLGNAFVGNEEAQEAIKNYEKAVEIKPDKIETWYNISVVYYTIEEFDLAMKNCKKALELRPDSSELEKLLKAIQEKQNTK